MRDGDLLELPVVVGALPGNDQAFGGERPPTPRGNSLALSVGELDPGLQQEVPSLAQGGVQIEQLRDGPGRRAGLATGDAIVALNHQQVRNVDDFNRVMESLPETGFIPIRVVSDGRGTTLVLELR